jgi:hypothetical protein
MGGQARPGGGGGDRGSIGILRWRLADDERAGKIPHKVAPGLPPKLGAKEDRGAQPDKRSSSGETQHSLRPRLS